MLQSACQLGPNAGVAAAYANINMKKTILLMCMGILIASGGAVCRADVQTTIICPIGFTCTPITRSASVCPAGYTCVPIRRLPTFSVAVHVSAVPVASGQNAGTAAPTVSATPTYTTIKPQSPTASQPILSHGSGGATVGFTQDYTYTLNAGSNPLYVSSDPTLALGTLSVGVTDPASSLIVRITAVPAQIAGDTANSYIIPAGGYRTFVATASVSNLGGPHPVVAAFMITRLYYSASASIVAIPDTYIDFGLENLQTSPPIQLMN